MLEHGGQVLSRMAVSGKEQRDPTTIENRDDAGGKHACSLRGGRRPDGIITPIAKSQYLHRRIVIVQHLALGCLANHLLEGRFGGTSHISRAFFRSMFAFIFILPWQQVFNGVVCGATYTPNELLCGVCTAESAGPVGVVFYYARFVGWWAVIVLLYISSQYSCGRWAKASLRRLGIV